MRAHSPAGRSHIAIGAVFVLIALTAACQGRAEGSVAAATAPPCDAALLSDALDAIPAIAGYRFQRTVESFGPDPSAAGPIDERPLAWSTTLTHGAYLAPDRFVEVVDDVEPDHEPPFWQVVQVGDAAWVEVSGEGARWEPTLVGLERAHKLDAINDYIAPEDRPAFAAGPAPDALPGQGGCPMAATVFGGRFIAVRIDRNERRVMAWMWSAGDPVTDRVAQRESLLVDYAIPSAAEFAAPEAVATP